MGYSMETALHATVSFIEGQLERGGYAVGTFLDIKGAFHNTPHQVVCEEALHRSVLEKLGYADDVVMMVRRPFLGLFLTLMQNALGTVERWCRGTGLLVNPLKTGLIVFTCKYKVGTIKGPIFEGTRLAPAKSVKYLGVILDKKLSWREHLESRCKTVVWWPRARKKVAVVALKHVRALILRGVLGAMRTTPVAAMDILLGIEPLYQVVVGTATIAAHRLACELKWKEETAHTRFPSGVLTNSIFGMRQDRMPAVWALDRHFKVHVTGLVDWKEPGTLVQAWDGNVWFTDGYKTGTSSDAGIVCRQRRVAESLPLDGYARVFQTEIVAILRCDQLALEGKETGGRVRICSNSQTAIKALEAPICTSRLVWDCRNLLEKLARDKEVIVTWVPGYSGIEGNEEADRLARAASRMEVFGPGPVLGVPFCRGPSVDRPGPVLGETSSEGLVRDIRSLSRRDARPVVQIMTGHGALNYHMHRLGQSDTAGYRACGEEEETSLHIFGDCPAYAGLRLKLLGSAFPDPGQISKLPMKDLSLFWRESELP
ncbi:uncharacterized protein LOC105202159 [Solenopsis invicta]|uniref:uncharacterized protein LOC105202159 n=1 Tax=Solenopsis invicta TaxID=13686 RepID=UPI00193EBACD|nr:uncharacterized protein LOC105202159 [Solenopsis invicta]